MTRTAIHTTALALVLLACGNGVDGSMEAADQERPESTALAEAAAAPVQVRPSNPVERAPGAAAGDAAREPDPSAPRGVADVRDGQKGGAQPEAEIRDVEERGGQNSTAGPQAGPAASVLRAASRTYEGIESLQASFEQELQNTLLGTATRSRGMLYQRQPDRFLMRFSEPAGDLILSDGRHFWVYYPSVNEDQVIRSPVGEPGRSGIDLRAQFIGDPVARFEAEYHGIETVRGRDAHVLTLAPRRAAGYRSLKVWIDARDYLVRRFELRDHQGLVRRFELMDLAVNPTLPDSLFRFTPPPDARIIDRG